MHHLKAQLEQLQNEIDQSEQEIDQGMQNLQDTQERVKELNAKKTALQRLLDDIEAAQTATNKGRQAAQKEVEDAQVVYDDLFPKVNGKLNDQQRKAVQDAIKAVDDQIKAAEAEIEALRGPRDQAWEAATKAEEEAQAKDQAYKDAQERLRQLPAEIQASQTNVARLKAALKSAANTQKNLDAYYTAGELKSAIEQLTELLKPEKESGLVDDLVSASNELRTARDDATDKKTAADDAQAALAEKEQELQRKVRGRPEAIRAAIAAIPAPPAQPAPAPQPVNP